MKAAALLAFVVGCQGQPDSFQCSKLVYPVGARTCVLECPDDGGCFTMKKAHCFRNGPRLSCSPTLEECDTWRVAQAAPGSCELAGPEQY